MFFRLKVALLYVIVYYLQINKLSTRINQTIEIVFRFLIFILKYFNR